MVLSFFNLKMILHTGFKRPKYFQLLELCGRYALPCCCTRSFVVTAMNTLIVNKIRFNSNCSLHWGHMWCDNLLWMGNHRETES